MDGEPLHAYVPDPVSLWQRRVRSASAILCPVCYSAMIEQSVKSLGIRFQARIQLDLFEELFRRRLNDERIKIPRAMERDFLQPTNASEARILEAIQQYREYQSRKWQQELHRQRERLAAAERSLAIRTTKKALSEQRIASNKMAWCKGQLEDLARVTLLPQDSRIFPQWYAPVVCEDSEGRIIKPMRYHLRPSDKPADIDQRFDGLYNARRDSLTAFWRRQFGMTHGIIVVTSFFENVARHAYEHRTLGAAEREQNLVIEFQPKGEAGVPVDMIVPCLWDHWSRPAEPELWSFAAITDEPPDDVRSAGHDRCVVPLREQNVALWLSPRGRRDQELFRILAERERYEFEHRMAG